MIISDDHRFVFIAVPKTASSSIEHVLRKHGRFYNRQRHVTAARVRQDMVERWNSYLSFAVIRDPVDWLHSWYKFWSAAAKDPKTGVANHNQLPDIPFVEFVSRTLEDRDKPWKNVGTQASRVCNEMTGGVLVSRLLCFDQLCVQFPKVLSALGLPPSPLPERNVSKLQQACPELPEELMIQVRRFWRDDFALYSRAHDDLAKEFIVPEKPVLAPKSDLLPQSLPAGELIVPSRSKRERRKRAAEAPQAPAVPLQGSRFASQDEIKTAIEAARKKVQRSPEDARSQLRLGKLLLKSGELGPAAEALRLAVSLNPSLVKSYRLLSAVLLRQGEVEEAVALSREALARRPNRPDLLKHLARALRIQAQVEEPATVQVRGEDKA